MPPRKKNASAIASSPEEVTRRSTRIAKKNSPPPNIVAVESSEDEISSTRANISVATGTESQQDELGDVAAAHATRSKSYASSRPSTANSEGVSRTGILSTPATKRDVDMLDVDDDGGEDELSNQGPVPKKTKPIKIVLTSSRKSRSKYDNPDEMLTNPRAPLGKVNLRDLLCSSKAWDILSPDEKKSVLDKFPDEEEIVDAGTENARPNIAALRNNDNFRHDAARYQDNLKKGWHDPEWIRQAQAAHRKREAGHYDDYLAARFENDWNMPMPRASGRDDDKGNNEIMRDEENDDENPSPMEGIEASEGEPLLKAEPVKENTVQNDGHEHSQDTAMT